MKSKIYHFIKNLPDEHYIFWVTLIFYILLSLLNPSNKIMAFSFVLLFTLYLLKVKNMGLSLFFTFISSSIVFTGKTYPIQLLPAGVFPIEIFPNGYFTNLVISSSHIIAFVMFIHIIRQLVLDRKKFKLNILDVFLIVFYFLKILSAVFASKDPSLSLPFEILSLGGLVAYFYSRIFLKFNFDLWRKISYLFSALVIFESILGISQLASKSPLYISLENQTEIEYFGHAVDETQFTFRPPGTFNHANALGVWTASICIFLVVTVLKNKSNIIWFSFFAGCLLIITTISRSAWLGFTAGILFSTIYISKQSKNFLKPLFDFILKWRYLIFPVFLLLFLFFVLPRAQSSVYTLRTDAGAAFFRRTQIQDAVELIKLHPILGVGTMMSVYEGVSLNLYTMALSIPLGVDNWYFGTALANGLLALFVFIFFVILSLRKLFETNKNSIVFLSINAVIICLFVAGVFQPDINIGFILVLLSLINNDSMLSANDQKSFKISHN